MSSTIDQITALIGELSFAEKLSINEQLASSIRKEGGGKVGKKVKAKAEKAEGSADKPKRKAALGTRAWTAYVKHCKMTMPDSFEGLTKESDKLVIVKGIRAEDPEGYKTFTEAWKAEHSEPASETASVADEDSVPEPEVIVPKVVAPKVKVVPKVVAPKAESKAAAESKVESKAEPKVESKVEPKAAKVTKAAKVAAKPVPKAKAKAKESSFTQKEIDGVSYWHEPETNGLWEVTGPTPEDGTGEWIGYFQPDDEAEPIRFTEAFGSDE